MDSYTKEHSAEYQAQAIIDIGFALHARQLPLAEVEDVLIETSHHTHYVIGTGSGDPEKMDPDASRETLDHSAMYILAVAWEDGRWHHADSYSSERAHRDSTVKLWRAIRTAESEEWTRAYHDPDPHGKKFGGQVTVRLRDGSNLVERLDNPNAHSMGARPFARADYVAKLETLTDGLAEPDELERFVGLVEKLTTLSPSQVKELSIGIPSDRLEDSTSDRVGVL